MTACFCQHSNLSSCYCRKWLIEADDTFEMLHYETGVKDKMVCIIENDTGKAFIAGSNILSHVINSVQFTEKGT